MPDLAKAYIAKDHEKEIYNLWLKHNAFKPKVDSREAFSILMPPPNANESLHVGHALGITVEDLMIRYARLKGKKTLWIPGTDHAGFETQVVYEKKLQKEGKSRFDFSPDDLRKNIREYVDAQREKIISQIKLLGASCDWDSLYFTLDSNIVETVYQTYYRLNQDKLLYRAKKLVNYCIKHDTSFSDLEVVYEDREGTLTEIKYPLSGQKNKFITVATTRPETMLGDAAVAVNPNDERYTNLIGKMVNLPLTDRRIPIVADRAVDPDFGTGAVKVTPAHSHIDYEISSRHDLPIIEIIDRHGKMIGPIPDEIKNKKIIEAREWVVNQLEKQKLINKKTAINHRVAVCYKCGTPIEPLMVEQWWIKTKPLAKRAIEAIKTGQITITPKESSDHLITWLENIIDWNISRQTVWGIPIPAWFKNGEIHIGQTAPDDSGDWQQDKDTFDTWFSSGQLPFAALGYPNDSKYKTFFPTGVMETARDILFFWVGRMIMLSLYRTDQVPFKHIYLHGLVLDPYGKKMSKSKGNTVNPLEVMEKSGTDALRWGLVHGTSAGQNFNMTEDRSIGGRNLANKIWNAARYILLISKDYRKNQVLDLPLQDLMKTMDNAENKAVLRDLSKTINEVEKCLDEDQFALATDYLFDFFWHRFCDQYLELSKKLISDQKLEAETRIVLIRTMRDLLTMFHPIMPFITESLWQHFYQTGWVENPLLITSHWPTK